MQSSVGTYQAPETMLIVVPDGAAQRYPAQFGQRCEPMAETQVEGVDGDPDAVTVGIVVVVVVVVGIGALEVPFAATRMLMLRVTVRWPLFAVTRNRTVRRVAVELAEM